MAAAPRAFTLSRVTQLSNKPELPKATASAPSLSRHGLIFRHQHASPFSASTGVAARRGRVSCLDHGGGNDFLSTQKLDRGFSVIANMLKRIEPLDHSVISKGVSDSAKDSMKQTVSTMLGLLPSDQFSVNIEFSKEPLHRLLFSGIVTGYTLWNAEYRVSLTRNLDASSEGPLHSATDRETESSGEDGSEKDESGEVGGEDDPEVSPQVIGDFSRGALDYIQQLASELSIAMEELNARKQEQLHMEMDRAAKNDLLDYLRSLDSDMVTELSRPSCMEVEDIMHQLVQNILRQSFRDDPTMNFLRDSVVAKQVNSDNGSIDDFCNTIGTSRGYLAKLLYWCMLLGHHFRCLENRLHLSCVVGLL